MANIIPLFGTRKAEQLKTTPDTVATPYPEPAPTPAPVAAAETEKVTLHDGDLVVHRRPDGTSKWQYRLRLPDGTYERKTTGKRKLDDAKCVAEARYQEVRWRETKGLSTRVASFGSAAESYIAHITREAELAPAAKRRARVKKAETLASMTRRYLVPHFDATPLDQVDARAVERFHAWYVEQWKAARGGKRVQVRSRDNQGRTYETPLEVEMPGSYIRKPGVNSRIAFEAIIRHIMERAVKDGTITRAEVPERDATKFVTNRRGGFTRSEQERLLEHLEARAGKAEKKHHRAARRLLWLWARFNFLAGLRPGIETATLRFKDVEFVPGAMPHWVVHVSRGKTGARSVVVDERLGEVLNSIREQHPDPGPDACLWVKPDGTRTTRFGAGFKAALKELGLDYDEGTGLKRTAYSMRHYAITDAIERGVNLSLLADNVGNSVEQISRTYNHVVHVRHAAELLKGTKANRK